MSNKELEDLIDLLEQKSMLKLTQEEREWFKVDFLNLQKSLKIFDEYDLINLEKSDRPFVIYQHYKMLREDEVVENNNHLEILYQNSDNFDKKNNLFKINIDYEE